MFNPVEVSDKEMAYPCNVIKLIPKKCLRGFSSLPENRRWSIFFNNWVFSGLPKGTCFIFKDGVDGEKAQRHIWCLMRTFSTKHEDKEDQVCFCFNEWVKDVVDCDGKSILKESPFL